MDPIIAAILAAVGLLAAMLLSVEVGWRIGAKRRRDDPKGSHRGVAALNASVFSLLMLLLAFVYSDASSRFDQRRRQIVEESNDIGTAWLRIAVVPPSAQPALRDAFRRYVDTRIDIYRTANEGGDVRGPLQRSSDLQREVWALAVAACEQADVRVAQVLLLPALNAMFDIASTRLSMTQMHPPALVFAMLGVLALASALLAGVEMAAGARRKWTHMIGFAFLISATVYMIGDIEYPRRGIVRIDHFDQMIVDLRAQMD